jgi:hypothetical protein
MPEPEGEENEIYFFFATDTQIETASSRIPRRTCDEKSQVSATFRKTFGQHR